MTTKLYFKIISMFVLLSGFAAHAQSSSKGGAGNGKKDGEVISLNPNARNTQVIIRRAKEEDQSAEYQGEDGEDSLKVLPPAVLRWKRPAIGLWASLQNSTVIKSQFQITADKVLVKKAGEFGFGFGGLIDFPMPGDHNPQTLRLRVGIDRVSVKPSTEILADYAATQLESSATLLTLTGYYRVAPEVDLDLGTLWFAGVGQLNHVFASHWPTQSQSGVSQLRSSYGFNFGVALGLEIPFSDVNDFGFAIDWYPLKGFSLQGTLRTSL